MEIGEDGKLRIVEVKWEQNGRLSALWEEVMRILLSDPLTSCDDGAKVRGAEGLEEGDDHA